jgi:hypothetical protein
MTLKIKVAVIIIVALTGCGAGLWLFSDPLPPVRRDLDAERLVDRMWEALNAQEWFSAEGARWTFRGAHTYVWHKGLGRVRADLGTLRVYFEPDTKRGIAFESGERVKETLRAECVQQAIDRFNNDSFWLLAPFKARDAGSTRSVVNEEGEPALLVHYTSGGTTPGDRYLWRFDDRGRPKSWKLWVQIIPVKGIELSWEDWRPTASGAIISHMHRSALLDIPLSDIQITSSYSELRVKDPLLISPQWEEWISSSGPLK